MEHKMTYSCECGKVEEYIVFDFKLTITGEKIESSYKYVSEGKDARPITAEETTRMECPYCQEVGTTTLIIEPVKAA